MIIGRYLTNPLLNYHLKKARSLLHNFNKIEFLHVYHSLNWTTNYNAKKVVNQSLGQLHIKEVNNKISQEVDTRIGIDNRVHPCC